MDYKAAINFITERRKKELFDANELFLSALQKNPELNECELKLRSKILKCAKSGQEDKDIAVLEREKAALLKKMGITQNMIAPPPRCRKCSDTALRSSKICDCAKSIAFDNENNIKIPLRDFSECDVLLFDKEYAVVNQKIFSDIRTITQLFPTNKKRTVLVSGATGTGKTFLAGCAAKALMERNFSTVALTAFEFNNKALLYHTTFDEKKFSYIAPLLDASFLIIDDLGSESMLKNITVEYLYLILNERLLSGKLTLITTNLSTDGILSRYGERIYSRLLAKDTGYHCTLSNSDLRIKLNKVKST